MVRNYVRRDVDTRKESQINSQSWCKLVLSIPILSVSIRDIYTCVPAVGTASHQSHVNICVQVSIGVLPLCCYSLSCSFAT